jgi:glycine cleavage system H protein
VIYKFNLYEWRFIKLIPKELFYTKEHEWCRFEEKVVVGITDYAQKELGDVVFIELPEVGKTVRKGDGIAVVESVKAVSDVYSPISGVITSVNKKLEDNPELINEDPYGEGWIAVVELSDEDHKEDLLDSSEYEQYLEGA